MQFDYLTLSSKPAQSIHEEISLVFKHFADKLESSIEDRVLRFTVFYSPVKGVEMEALLKQQITQLFKHTPPANSLLAQPPYGEGNILIEACYTSSNKYRITRKSFDNIAYSLVKTANEEHLFISGAKSKSNSTDIQKLSEDSFYYLDNILKQEGFSYSNIVRQWNYIEDILCIDCDNKQNYQIFNDVRTKSYDDNGLIAEFPAATGIGIKKGGIVIEVHAAKGTELNATEVKNPEQTDAFKYSQEVLEGVATAGFETKSTPKFARGKRLNFSGLSQFYISGTASIKGEDTIGIDDIKLQTETTLDNILTLTESAINGEQLKLKPSKSNYIRVYVKNPSDMPVVKSICKKAYPDATCIIVEADICRDNLLVEIEGTLGLFSL